MKRIVIVGGGIAGLSVAWAVRWRDPGAHLTVLERGSRTGGNVRTEHVAGYTCESGPDGFLDNAPETLRLVRQIGLERRLLASRDAARKRYIFRRGQLHQVPTSPQAMITSGLLSPLAKLRVLCEPLAWSRPDDDESIHAFARRHIGEEAASVLVDAMVSGIFAGDARALSLRACFPRMFDLEAEHGSLVRAMLATRKQRTAEDSPGAPAGKLTSFTSGMSELVDALTDMLADVVRLETRVLDVRCDRGAGHWNILTPTGPIEADAVVLAGPAADSSECLRTCDAPLARELDGITTASLVVLALGYDAAAIRPLDGFGFLVPRGEGIRTLGALWETSIYPNRAPAGKALLRIMVGGASDRDAVTLTDEELLGIVSRDLETTMGITARPEFVRLTRHHRGIPQYERGHLSRLARIDGLVAAHSGLHLAGNSYRGVSMNSCIAEADRIAEAVLAGLAPRPLALAG
jgi:oxygen-dependent protoporphyrinogen oxidase